MLDIHSIFFFFPEKLSLIERMIRYFFKVYLFFFICTMFQEYNGVSRKCGKKSITDVSSNETDCDRFNELNGVECEKGFHNYHIQKLSFKKGIFIFPGMLTDCDISSIYLENRNISVAENFLEGVQKLLYFMVKESSIEVRCILFFNK